MTQTVSALKDGPGNTNRVQQLGSRSSNSIHFLQK